MKNGPSERRALMGLKMRVRTALQKRHGEAGSGPGWRTGRLLNENVYNYKPIKKMSAEECKLALDDLASTAD